MGKGWQSWLTRSSASGGDVQAHMTFGQTTFGRTLSRTGLMLKKRLWVWPIVAVLVLSVLGWLVSGSIQRTMDDTLRSQLTTLLSVEKAMLEKWLHVQESSATTLANSRAVRRTIDELLDAPPADENIARLSEQLDYELEPGMSSHDFIGYVVVNRQRKIIAATTRELVGQEASQYDSFLSPAFEGKPVVSPPFPSTTIQKDIHGRLRSGVPTMFVAAPVLDENLQIVAVLGFRIRPEKEFTDILQLGRIGESGETYAINQDGLMISNSRFDDALILLGLLPDDDYAASILNVHVRDPGGNMLEGYRPGVRRRELELTQGAAAAVTGETGVSVEGYRDYRGVPVVGAWTWLPEYKLGVLTEIDVAEAYRPLTILKWSFYSLYVLLGVSAAAIFVFTVIVTRLQRQAQRAAIEAKQLGQYQLQDKIGAGAMGIVYKGRHSMLRRPTAIKLLDVNRVNDSSIERFEREVQITCSLNNPHTIAIYDYGRTPEGIFYYAMEYLDGVDLQKLVEQTGPQPEGRVVNILRQVCESLYEAHSQGLVHRDIKPANIMLNRRGGQPDVVKVLDFGLVRALDERKEASGAMSGTPLYMSSEAIQTPDLIDGRSDLYAVGAVGYFLLTGQTAFSAKTLSELCRQHLTMMPDPPSQRLGRAVSPELEYAVLACLEKDRAKRPQTARDLIAMLDRVSARWTFDDAESWWSRYDRGQNSPFPAEGHPLGASYHNGQSDLTGATQTAHNTKTVTDGLDRTTIFESPPDETKSS